MIFINQKNSLEFAFKRKGEEKDIEKEGKKKIGSEEISIRLLEETPGERNRKLSRKGAEGFFTKKLHIKRGCMLVFESISCKLQ